MINEPSKVSPVQSESTEDASLQEAKIENKSSLPIEIGGPKGLEPTRYGDWEKAGRCTDF